MQGEERKGTIVVSECEEKAKPGMKGVWCPNSYVSQLTKIYLVQCIKILKKKENTLNQYFRKDDQCVGGGGWVNEAMDGACRCLGG